MPSLNWIGKDKIVNHDKDVPFRLLRKNKKYSLGESENLIVEGDNLEALKALMPFYCGKVKCVYIDPPYNTGNEKWVYNDRVNSPKIKEWFQKVVGPEGEDLTRHDKWLCMMYPRLKLLRDLLSENGVIFISIDDNEHCYLKQILDDIFGPENFVANIIWQNKGGSGSDPKHITIETEYALCYGKNKKNLGVNRYEANTDDYKLADEHVSIRGRYKLNKLDRKSLGYVKTLDFPIKQNGLSALPGGNENNKKIWRWRWSQKKVLWGLKKGFIILKKDKNGKVNAYYKLYEFCDNEGIILKRHYPYSNVIPNGIATVGGTKELEEIFGKRIFEYPKSVKLIKHLLKIGSNNDSIILDSFAGSGTTAHAVLSLNKEDGGNRKFILVEMEKDIAKDITAERVKRVAQGYSYKTGAGKIVKVPGLGGGFEYLELGEPLFDKDGKIGKTVGFLDMARYVYFTETRVNLEKKNIKGNYLGNFGESRYFLFFDGIGGNILDKKSAREVKKMPGRKVVYADKCLLDEDALEENRIVFKQIPYQVKVY